MVYHGRIFEEGGSHLYRFAFLAAKELLLTACKWRNDLERLGPRQLDLSEADKALEAAILSLEIALSPPVRADGLFIDPRENPDWDSLPGVKEVDVLQELVSTREGRIFSGLGFSGRSAYEVVLKMGEATQRAVVFLAQTRDQQALDCLLRPDSPLRTKSRGLGEISETEADRVEAECLTEAEQAWAARSTAVEAFVTLQQAAAMVSRSKKSLERRKGNMPVPRVSGGGGKPDEWAWSELRPWLEKEFDRPLPERFPADRFRPTS